MIKVNTDTELVAEIRTALDENGGYCPCRPVKTVDTKCMCKEFRQMIKDHVEGLCHCGLYYNEVVAHQISLDEWEASRE